MSRSIYQRMARARGSAVLCVAAIGLAAGALIAPHVLWVEPAQAQATPASPPAPALIPAPRGSAQQDLQQPDHAFDSATGQNLVWDRDRKSWIDAKSGQALGFQGALAKDGTVIPAPAPSSAKDGTKTQARQDPNDPERAYNPISGQNLVWDRARGTWIDSRSQKNVGFQGAYVPTTAAGGPPSGASAPAAPGFGLSFGFGFGTGGGQERDKRETGGRQERGKDDRGGAEIPIIPFVPLQPGLAQSNPPPPVQPSGGHTVERPPTPPPPTQTAVTPPPQQPPTAVTPPAAPDQAVCGPVVTAKVFATLAKMTSDFNKAPGQKVMACHNLYGLTSFESAWDIQGLDPGTSPGASDDPGYRIDPSRARRAGPPQAQWNPQAGEWRRTADGGNFTPWLTGYSKACAIPRPDDACAATVQFMGTCQHAQVVNYAMWGRVNKLCGYPLNEARAAVSARSFFGDDEMKQRQLDMTNIGYAANAAEEVREGFLTTPSQFQKCLLKCPVKLAAQPPWSYIWEGFK
jgi:hypothetical protein